MKQHTQRFKEIITELGKQQSVLITYTIDNEEVVLGVEEINSATPRYDADLLKSVMKELHLDSNVDIPVGTEINFKYGLLVDGAFEYLDYGNYIVYTSEKKEDTLSYEILCYDKMLYAMKDYEELNITYPCTVKEYINAIATKLGLTFANNNGIFPNYNTQIVGEFYLSIDEETQEKKTMGYTYRDILDDLAEVTASVICINNNGQLEVRDIRNTDDTIDEEYLKDTNVNFGEVFGPINAVVLSRSTSDNIYRNDVASINANGLYEIKISDNQILNQNNRDTFIQAIFDKLKGLTYGICDFSSTGIMYYDLLDRFNVKVGDNTYSIVMFHNEQNITQGLEENIYVEKPKTSETDYTKADKTDIKLNQTNLIVDKQNGTIEALVTSNSDLQQKTAQLIIDVEGIKGEISDVADVTTTADGYGTVQLDNISGDSEPIYLKVYPVNEDIIALKPQTDLYPRTDLYPHSREVYFKNTSSQEPYEVVFDIPTDLYQLNGVYDECILSYEAKELYVIHRIGINEDGEKYLLETEEIENFDYPSLPLTEGNYQVYIPAFNMAYIYVRLMSKNIYTEQFATKVELNSKIEQTATDITTSVNKTLTNYDTKTEVNSKIQQTANDITSTVSQTYETKSNANSKYSEIKQTTDSISSTVSKKVGNDEIISRINQSAEQVQINANKISLARKNS